MHMSDALITPVVGGTMLAGSAGLLHYSAKKLETDILDKKIPYMAVVGAFVFAAQMINFAIPGTGSSGHIGGGMLLSILLGPHAGFLSMATILLIQALFFADGGLLAFGCNLLNLGLFTCYVAYPLIYKPMSRGSKKQMYIGTILATVVGLQLGAFSVVIQTVISDRTALSFHQFLLFMQPIHLAIGIVEGLITAVVVSFLYQRREDLVFDFFKDVTYGTQSRRVVKRTIQAFLVMTLIVGGLVSQYASSHPDGLEWSIESIVAEAASEDESTQQLTSTIETKLSEVQEGTAILPDYDFKKADGDLGMMNVGTSVSGVVGSLLVLSVISVIGLGVRGLKRRRV